jgi:hypothetical protein
MWRCTSIRPSLDGWVDCLPRHTCCERPLASPMSRARGLAPAPRRLGARAWRDVSSHEAVRRRKLLTSIGFEVKYPEKGWRTSWMVLFGAPASIAKKNRGKNRGVEGL